MSNGHRPRKPRQGLLGEYIGDVALTLFNMEMFAVVGNDSRGFLASMLKRVEAEVGEIGRFFVAVDAKRHIRRGICWRNKRKVWGMAL